MDDAQRENLRGLFRKYKRFASRLRDGMSGVEEGATITFHVEWKQGKGGSASFDEDSMLVRLAALLRPFMNAGSPIALHSVWNAITSVEGLVTPESRDVMVRNFEIVEGPKGLDGIALRLNNRDLKASDVYFAYAEGAFFDEDPEAKKLLEGLSFGPGAKLVQFLFHSACQNYCELVFAMLEVILTVERNTPALALAASESRCIYCLESEGEFGDEEHVIPEAFGLDDMVLRGGNCKNCKLSGLDQYLADFEPLAMLRVQNVPLTKKGKFPRAETRDFTIEKIKPRHIRVTAKSGRNPFVKEALPDGRIKLTLKTTTRPVDAFRLARAIFKIALGIIAVDAGKQYACEPRFDAARTFIQGTGTMPNHILISRKFGIGTTIETGWYPDYRTVVFVSFWGLCFVVNLEAFSLDIPADAPQDTVFASWLGEMTAKGIVEACLGPCVHQRPSDH